MNIFNDVAKSDTEYEGGVQAAIARTATRSLALYFSRPVRLFRPSKVSGWHSLRSLATYQGASLSPQYILSLLKLQGFGIIPKHFIPPMAVNALLGTILWTGYAEAHSTLGQYTGNHPIFLAAVSGGLAGGVQALAAAPVENVRLLMEGGSPRHSWSHAWKEVFRKADSPAIPIQRKREDIRHLRSWMNEVRDMAGHGWNGWGWGCAKDICGFAAFFSIFEVTRHLSVTVKMNVQGFVESRHKDQGQGWNHYLPRAVNSIILITGGVIAGLSYELMCQPWDVARRAITVENVLASHSEKPSIFSTLMRKVQAEGVTVFFHNSQVPFPGDNKLAARRRLYPGLRTLGRVGPWGIGFLVWEMYGSGLYN
ncbi:hypothetical protein BDQ12DRAFT_709976 [Crucibulum laeve]|uniref:Mitochondrial carrier domain-containing protein n=1 Tax=Crucibulum laeve TaxID=68775 RepID=A0A5C3MBC0_9AGAR|nr:hypothetical protein BDQ12DRAFT_709976 [Crucibulum laeve]